MVGRQVGGIQTEGACLGLALDVGGDFLEQLFVGIEFVAAYVDHEGAQVGDDVVLGTGIDLGNAHFYRAQQIGCFGEAVGAEPFDVVEYLVDGIFAFFAGGMSGFSPGCYVEYHQAFLGNGRVHFRRLTYDAQGNGRELGKDAFYAVLSGNLFFAGCQKDQVIALFGGAQVAEGLKQ